MYCIIIYAHCLKISDGVAENNKTLVLFFILVSYKIPFLLMANFLFRYFRCVPVYAYAPVASLKKFPWHPRYSLILKCLNLVTICF